MSQGRDERLAELDRAVAALEERGSDAGPGDRLELSRCLQERARLRAARGHVSEGLADQDRAVTLLAGLTREVPALRPELGVAHGQRAELELAVDRPRDALHDLEVAGGLLARARADAPGAALALVPLRLRQAQLLDRAGEADAALERASEALRLARALPGFSGGDGLVVDALRARARLRRSRDPAAAEADLRAALDLLPEVREADAEALKQGGEVVTLLAALLDERAERAEALELRRERLSALEARLGLGESVAASPLADAAQDLAWSLKGSGDPGGGLAVLEEALSDLEQAPALEETERGLLAASLLSFVGNLRYERRELDLALAALERAEALASAAGADDPVGLAVLLDLRVTRGLLWSAARRPEQAIEEATAGAVLLVRAAAIAPPEAAAALDLVRLRAFRLLGENAAAEAAAGSAEPVLEGSDDPMSEGLLAEVRLERGLLRLVTGDLEGSRRDLDRALDTLARHRASGVKHGELEQALALLARARLRHATAAGEAAASELDEGLVEVVAAWGVLRHLADRGWRTGPELAEAELTRALLLTALGRPEGAAAALSAAEAAVASPPRPLALLEVLAARARLDVEAEARAASLVAAALEGLEGHRPPSPGLLRAAWAPVRELAERAAPELARQVSAALSAAEA